MPPNDDESDLQEIKPAVDRQRKISIFALMLAGFVFNFESTVIQPTAAFYILVVRSLISVGSINDSVQIAIIRGDPPRSLLPDYGWTLASYSLARVIFSPVFGAICPRLIKTKPTIIIGLLICAGGNLLYALAPHISVVILGRVIAGMGAGISRSLFLCFRLNSCECRRCCTCIGLHYGCNTTGGARESACDVLGLCYPRHCCRSWCVLVFHYSLFLLVCMNEK